MEPLVISSENINDEQNPYANDLFFENVSHLLVFNLVKNFANYFKFFSYDYMLE